ncbi:MAG: biotin--[acetyl-CoA-carboxylase] ligase [Thermoleophilaceae bacterium]|nr:biotin--[acetyl-CoA-carboxylase] ligase [Thermoleophilaceae bacterium]
MIGTPRVHFRLTDSTNERARTLAAAGVPHGTLVTADEQQAGRGRQGRAWTAPPRSAVLMSVVLRDLSEMLPLAAAVAVCEALPVAARIKWPNDVWIDGRKVAGILVEGRPQEGWAVLGIGLNVATEEFPAELRPTATSLHLEGVALTTDEARERLLAALAGWLPRPANEVLAAWRPRDALLGRPVRWSNGSKEGIAAGVDDSGALIVQTVDGRVTLDAGEVHLER